MTARYYYLGPWVQATETNPKNPSESYVVRRAPAGTVGLVNLCALDGSGVAFFSTSAPLAGPAYTDVGAADGTLLSAYAPTAAQRASWATLLGLAAAPASGTLLDMLWDVLTVDSDPDGATRAKPIIPTEQGVLELHLGGHSLVRAVRMPSDARACPHWDKIQRVHQNDYRDVLAVSQKGKSQKARDLHRRFLGSLARKYRLSGPDARDLLIPADLPRVLPLAPETTITDDFNRANADPPSNAAGGWAWTEASGTAWAIVSNGLKYGSQTSTPKTLRAESDLSGADHYAQIKSVALPYDDAETRQGACARFDSAAETCYAGALALAGGGARSVYLYAASAGTFTQIASASYAWADGDTEKTEANGSTITLYVNGVSRATVTDTAISSGTRTGIYARYVFNASMDDFEAADLGGGGGSETDVTGAGGIAFAGAGSAAIDIVRAGAGGAVFSGAATSNIDRAVQGAGGAAFLGSATSNIDLASTGTGSIAYGGAVSGVINLGVQGAGSVVFGGIAPVGGSLAVIGSGTITFSGAAPFSIEGERISFPGVALLTSEQSIEVVVAERRLLVSEPSIELGYARPS